MLQDNLTLDQVQTEIKKLQELKKSLKEASKKEKVLKGRPCRFYNKAGELIEGLGVDYIVVRMNGTLYYKQKDSVEFLDNE